MSKTRNKSKTRRAIPNDLARHQPRERIPIGQERVLAPVQVFDQMTVMGALSKDIKPLFGAV